jgi:hypothetical protein
LSDAAMKEAFYWGVLFLYFVLHGPGPISVDGLLRYLIRRRQETGIAEGDVPSPAALHGR